MNNDKNQSAPSGSDALAKAAEIRKSTQVPNTTASSHEIHGDLGFGNASETGSIPVSGI